MFKAWCRHASNQAHPIEVRNFPDPPLLSHPLLLLEPQERRSSF
jgi:hypothetical protein